ncbi:MAG: hypothetical protein LBV12_11425 [Puniceicoccales bacterium]|nr:hypothetical protein [Puniceicoccales bacterium]
MRNLPLFILIVLVSICRPVSAETLQLGATGTVKIDLLPQWKTKVFSNYTKAGVEYQIELKAPDGVKASGAITIGVGAKDFPMTKEIFEKLVDGYSKRVLERSVEKKADFRPFNVKKGTGKYCVLTDSEVNEKNSASNQYRQAALFFAFFDRGEYLIAMILVDDVKSRDFPKIKDMMSTIEPKLALPSSAKAQLGKTGKGVSIGTSASKVAILLPSADISQKDDNIGGGTSRPGYFYCTEPKAGIIVSGWIEPVERFRHSSVKAMWEEEVSRKTRAMANMAPKDVAFQKVNEWEVILYDQAMPVDKLSNSHIRANLMKDGSWIDLHLSLTGQGSSAEMRKKLLDYLRDVKIQKAQAR